MVVEHDSAYIRNNIRLIISDFHGDKANYFSVKTTRERS